MTKVNVTPVANVECPVCGTKLSIVEINNQTSSTKNDKAMKADAKLEALRKAGVNVDNLFSMKSVNGKEILARMNDGNLTIVPEDDPIFQAIVSNGTVPNPRLFRRWVMSQVFHMLSYKGYRGEHGFVAALQMKGYKYQWKMVLEEFRVQIKLADKDPENFTARNRWFNRETVAKMCQDYISKLVKHISQLKVRHCKGVPYIKIRQTNVFTSDLNVKVFKHLQGAAKNVANASSPMNLLHSAINFYNLAEQWLMAYDLPMSQVFKDAYKGAGAYFTMKNLILFHGATFKNGCVKLSQQKSLNLLEEKAVEYADEGWRLFGLMKKLIKDSNIDIEKKMAEWRN